MAKFRQIHVSFWQDGFILTLPPEEKYFYLYLMTNSKTTQCGIYELPLKVVEMETGLTADRIFELIYKFVGYKRIKFNEETREIMLVNWLKHNSLKSPKVRTCAAKELESIKHIPFVEEFNRLCKQYGYHIDTVSIPYPKGYRTGLDHYGEEEEKEEEQEQQQEKASAGPINLFRLFESEGFGFLSGILCEKLTVLECEYSNRWVEEAMKEAVHQGKRSLSYVEGILKRWKAEGIDTPWTKEKPSFQVVSTKPPKRLLDPIMPAEWERSGA